MFFGNLHLMLAQDSAGDSELIGACKTVNIKYDLVREIYRI